MRRLRRIDVLGVVAFARPPSRPTPGRRPRRAAAPPRARGGRATRSDTSRGNESRSVVRRRIRRERLARARAERRVGGTARSWAPRGAGGRVVRTDAVNDPPTARGTRLWADADAASPDCTDSRVYMDDNDAAFHDGTNTGGTSDS